jgi:ABC-2 type transport system ATP-binding protein
MIEVDNLVKKYGSVIAVKGISFTAESGQVTGFLGPNGAGKTTTMRILTGYAPPSAGRATVAGYDVFDQSLQVRQHVGYLPESVPLYRDMTARGYLKYLGEIRGVPQRNDRALDVLGRVGLGKRADSIIRKMSKGMKQRVGLAAALLHDPDVLILDEPTIGLDPIQVLELRDLVSELGREHTVLFSTHILPEAEQVCDRVVIINQGEIVAQGSPASLREELERGQRVLIRTEESPDTILDTVQGLDAVQEAFVERDAVVALPVDRDRDPRPLITSALVNAGYNVLEVRPAANNLEEIFLELTRRSMGYSDDDQTDVAETPAPITADGTLLPTDGDDHEREAQA